MNNMSAQEIQRDKEALMPTFARYQVCFERGKGAYLYTPEGEAYLDLLSGIGVNSLGHCPKSLNQIYANQGSKLVHTSNLYVTMNRAPLAEKLIELSGLNAQVFFSNSGAEANECAIKLARRFGVKNNQEATTILSLKSSFHGRTLATAAATGDAKKAELYPPVMPGFKYIERNNIQELEAAFEAGDILACLFEPIQGEAGVFELDEEYLKKAQELCNKHSALFILDEVQTGMFRTCKPFAFQHYGLKPDIVTVAKALGNGFPIAATLAKKELAANFDVGDHGTTMGGSEIGCAIALKVCEELSNPELLSQASENAKYLREELVKISAVSEVRGRGYMFGIGLDKKALKERKAQDIARILLEKHKILINAPRDESLRLLPPLICTKQDFDKLLKALKAELS